MKPIIYEDEANSYDEDDIKKLIEENDELFEEVRFLDALRAAGVDNWDGYDFAKDIMEDS